MYLRRFLAPCPDVPFFCNWRSLRKLSRIFLHFLWISLPGNKIKNYRMILLFTSRYLATGNSFHSLHYEYLLGRFFPFEGQCRECFTSRRLIWDTDGLGLPRDTPLEVTFCSWDSVIKLWTRTSLYFLCHFTTTCFMEQEGIEDGHIC